MSPPLPRRDLELDERFAVHRTDEEQAAHDLATRRYRTLARLCGHATTEADFASQLRQFAHHLEAVGFKVDRVATPEDSRWRLFDTDGTEITLEMVAPPKPQA